VPAQEPIAFAEAPRDLAVAREVLGLQHRVQRRQTLLRHGVLGVLQQRRHQVQASRRPSSRWPRHRWELKEVDGGTHLVNAESFTGPMAADVLAQTREVLVASSTPSTKRCSDSSPEYFMSTHKEFPAACRHDLKIYSRLHVSLDRPTAGR
jgi:hypothetical protein